LGIHCVRRFGGSERGSDGADGPIRAAAARRPLPWRQRALASEPFWAIALFHEESYFFAAGEFDVEAIDVVELAEEAELAGFGGPAAEGWVGGDLGKDDTEAEFARDTGALALEDGFGGLGGSPLRRRR